MRIEWQVGSHEREAASDLAGNALFAGMQHTHQFCGAFALSVGSLRPEPVGASKVRLRNVSHSGILTTVNSARAYE